MALLELLKGVGVAILATYLSLTTSLADFITQLIGDDSLTDVYRVETVQEKLPTSTEQETGKNHTEVSPITETITEKSPEKAALLPIPRILLENPEYQQAALGASVPSTATTTQPDTISPEQLTSALVNIYCQYQTKKEIRTTTGTGFFIHQNGIILTNAHVAQFLLLKNRGPVTDAHCTIRTGNPATAAYEAELLYISPAWILRHAQLINETMPSGTGERDYALLYIARSLNDQELPRTFPALPIDTTLVSQKAQDTEVLLGGYPAEVLYTEGADAELIPKVATTTISTLYTFGSNYADIFSVTGSAVGEHGASGGPVVRNEHPAAIGLIVTKGNSTTDGEHSLRALTLSYIDRTITEETGFSLLQNMQGDLPYRAAVFEEALGTFLSQLLTYEL